MMVMLNPKLIGKMEYPIKRLIRRKEAHTKY
jgi:hypothetical protein